MSHNPSQQQSAIYRFIELYSKSLIIMARAGSGKTTTILEALKKIPQSRRTIFLAFNKSIATELKGRVRKGVDCMTVNSLGYQALRRAFPGANLNEDKVIRIYDEIVAKQEYPLQFLEENNDQIISLIRYGRTVGITPALKNVKRIILPDTVESWKKTGEYYGIVFKDEVTRQMAFTIASEVLKKSLETSPTMEFDYDDQVIMPVIYDLPLFKYDDIIIDEAQDISETKLQLILASLKPSGRVIAVGDDKQSIYAFTGASPDAMENIKNITRAHTLYLSCTYRCAKKITNLAKEMVADIEYSPNASEGEILYTGKSFLAHEMKDGEMVVSRFNAPIMKLALRLFVEQIPFNFMGSDGKVEEVAKIFKDAGELTGTEIIDQCNQRLENEIKQLEEAGENIEAISDSLETVKMIADSFPALNGLDISLKLKEVFAKTEDKKGVKLCTIHKSKGLEAEKVYFLNSHDLPSRYAKKDWELTQETNLKYVAVTRAKKVLEFIAI